MKILLHGAYGGSDRYPEFTGRGFVDAVGKKNLMIKTASERKGKREGRNVYGLKEASMDDLDSFDLIVFSYHSFFDKDFGKILNHNTSAKKIYIDTEDNFFVRSIYKHKEIDCYFKREIYREIKTSELLQWGPRYLYGLYVESPSFDLKIDRKMGYGWYMQPFFHPFAIAEEGRFKKMLPFPIIYVPDTPKKFTASNEREYDVSFTLGSHGYIKIREDIRDCLKRMQSERPSAKILIKSGMDKKEYQRVLFNSKSSVSVRGLGYDTYRYWEIPYYGTMLISQRLPIVIPHNFIDGVSALFFSSRAELKKKIEKYVLDSEEWKHIAKEGQKLYFKHHTPKKRVEELVLKYVK